MPSQAKPASQPANQLPTEHTGSRNMSLIVGLKITKLKQFRRKREEAITYIHTSTYYLSSMYKLDNDGPAPSEQQSRCIKFSRKREYAHDFLDELLPPTLLLTFSSNSSKILLLLTLVCLFQSGF